MSASHPVYKWDSAQFVLLLFSLVLVLQHPLEKIDETPGEDAGSSFAGVIRLWLSINGIFILSWYHWPLDPSREDWQISEASFFNNSEEDKYTWAQCWIIQHVASHNDLSNSCQPPSKTFIAKQTYYDAKKNLSKEEYTSQLIHSQRYHATPSHPQTQLTHGTKTNKYFPHKLPFHPRKPRGRTKKSKTDIHEQKRIRIKSVREISLSRKAYPACCEKSIRAVARKVSRAVVLFHATRGGGSVAPPGGSDVNFQHAPHLWKEDVHDYVDEATFFFDWGEYGDE
ncbi:hypothetical protein JTE90_019873 [Oedothorax gibbosus]|uniref:Uncharacterized protein n=1 Tax=Oedothorax gibbosus TaxID=931172 RepID=A0AAV6VZZ5_9ARAC|nr:hypothetical protein JTE90_019873 [Oedothorax gibbosus]